MKRHAALGPHTVERLRGVIGAQNVLTGIEDTAPYYRDWRGRVEGRGLAVLRPENVQQIQDALAFCTEYDLPVVPQGGNTGLVGGGIPLRDFPAIVLSTDRLTALEPVDRASASITVQAGVTLAQVQQAAAEAGFLFPLRLGSEGTCRIGGNIATNAGGILTLRYGNMREQVLGLEAVLPDGRLWRDLSPLRKNNTGYDLKQLFIGSEGTLGVITAATLRLQPAPAQTATAMVALASPEAAVALYRHLAAALGPQLSAAELMPRLAVELAQRHIPGTRAPFFNPPPWMLLVEATTPTPGAALEPALVAALEGALMQAIALDAVVAQSGRQVAEFWHLREAIVEAQRVEGGSIKHDIGLPLAAIPAFLEEASAAVAEAIPGIRPMPFGHIGDGNLHFNLTQPEDWDTARYLARWDRIAALVHDIVMRHGGTISAEHGIGSFKREELARLKDPVALDVMRAIKAALDPHGLMNPGKLL